MNEDKPGTLRATDDGARLLARQLMAGAQTAALAAIDPEQGGPQISRIAILFTSQGECLTLISDLSRHAQALRKDSRAALLIGEPGTKGDPLTHPRLSLRVTARAVQEGAEQARCRENWLQFNTKAKLYVDFADFRFVRFEIHEAHLIAGFGKAYALSEKDLTVS